MKRNGKELMQQFVAKGVNAMWVRGRGMIFMSGFYGTDVAVCGTYPVYGAEVCEKFLRDLADWEGSTDEYHDGAPAPRSGVWCRRWFCSSFLSVKIVEDSLLTVNRFADMVMA
jgi:hypothetical protein